jgi:hypothetical protein
VKIRQRRTEVRGGARAAWLRRGGVRRRDTDPHIEKAIADIAEVDVGIEKAIADIAEADAAIAEADPHLEKPMSTSLFRWWRSKNRPLTSPK